MAHLHFLYPLYQIWSSYPLCNHFFLNFISRYGLGTTVFKKENKPNHKTILK